MAEKRRKHVPLRSCVACHERRAKRDLIRIVRTPEGAIEVDSWGKRAGRGAYVCRDPSCWQAALEPRRLSRALKCSVSEQDVATLKALIASSLADELPAQALPEEQASRPD